MNPVRPDPVVPDRYRNSVISHVMVDGAAEAIEFYRRAFGATELIRIADADGRILHAEITIAGSLVMLGDADPPFDDPRSLGGLTVGLHVYVPDVDATVDAAVAAGAELLQAPQDMFYGDRMAMLKDPFGHIWVLLTHKEDLPLEEIKARGEAMLRGASPQRKESSHR
jgi:PhnB protein